LLYEVRIRIAVWFGYSERRTASDEFDEVIMLAPKYFIYMVTGPGLTPQIEMSSNLRIDAAWWVAKGYQELTFFQPAQTIWVTEAVVRELRLPKQGLTPKRFFKLVRRLAGAISAIKYCSYRTQMLEGPPATLAIPDGLEQHFGGKCLLGVELPEVIRAAGFEVPWNPEDWMQQLVLEGKITRAAAVGYNAWGLPECRRCGATNGIGEADCFFCGEVHCLTCTNCQSLGLAKSCTPLYIGVDPGNRYTAKPLQPQLDFSLTPAQQRAYVKLGDFLDTRATIFLVWAVCGGGKTEVSFGVIARVLAAGGRVLFAIPRKDVVRELWPRFQRAFPTITIAALYGGSRHQAADAQLVVATTHQCVRFYHCFDLVVLDEADAFPYQGSEMLHHAVNRSLKANGRLIVMTATPDRHLRTQAASGKLPYVSIPARYHRQPLIVPQIVKAKIRFDPRLQWEPPEIVGAQLWQAKTLKRKLLVFLPTIQLIETMGKAIVQWGLTKGIFGRIIHSQTNNVNRNKELISEGKLDFLVTSTVLERGITIRDLDVLVLYADYERVFDCRTLIQIAGRAGRGGETAQVFFYAEAVTRAMQECCRWIRQLNQDGLQLGYLDR
jgi:competence protein ComFA